MFGSKGKIRGAQNEVTGRSCNSHNIQSIFEEGPFKKFYIPGETMAEPVTMIPQVFLSLSGKDDQFVEKVWRHLPEGLALFYRYSFANGERLLEAMENGVDQASVFVFFASADSIESCWARFEVDRARIAKIKRPNIRTLVFPLSRDITPTMLPGWMQEFWVPAAGWNPRDISRYIRNTITAPPIAPAALSIPVIGRGQLLDVATQRLMSSVAETNATPNVFLFGGIAGIGRRTFARYFMRQAFPALPNLAFGPEIQLPQFADLADLYRSLREQIESNFSIQSFERDLNLFRNLDLKDQISEVSKSAQYFGDLGQAVFVATGSGLLEERGNLKPWVGPLFEMIGQQAGTKMCFASNRQLRDEDLRQWKNALQIFVPPLKEPDIGALMTATSTAFGGKPIRPTEVLLRSIGGHAQVAKAAVRLMSQKGEHFFDVDPRPLYSLQDEILSENLELNSLSQVQQEILCMLSWVPQLDGHLLESAAKKRHGIDSIKFAEALDDLILGCLVLILESGYTISSAIRQMFRRKYGYGPDGLIESFSAVLQESWSESLRTGEFSTDLFDAFVFMHALEGRSLPREFRDLLLPSTLQQVVQDTYSRGRYEDDSVALRRVTTWGAICREMKMDEAVREEILSTVILAHVRLSEYSEAEKILLEFDRLGYRSASFLRGFALRRQGAYRDALPYLKEALAARKYIRSTVQECATCYQKLGQQRELAELVDKYRSLVEDNVPLLDFHIGTLIAGGKIDEAQAAIRRLRSLADNEGRAIIRQAQIFIQQHNPAAAEAVLTDLIQRREGNPVTARRWRAIAAMNLGNFANARRDIEYIRGRTGRQSTALRLDVYYAIADGDYDRAERLFSQLPNASNESILKMRILSAKAGDVRTSLAEKERLRGEAGVLRRQNRLLGEYDFD
ncbi:MAG: TIR domain-containing protein [Proteobacteria bacterium]|nr:TIR domain-containing protein [Pseudomonadota bacterium]